MVIMSLLFILLLAFSVAALAVTQDQQRLLITTAWNVSESQHKVVEKKLGCCGLEVSTRNLPECKKMGICWDGKCPACYEKYRDSLDKALNVSGGIGLFFSFSLLLAVYLTVRYRNQKDPRRNADAFL